MGEYKSNSNASRENPPAEDKRAGKVITGGAEVQKKNWLQRVAERIAGKNGETLQDYLIRGVSDMIVDSIRMIGDMIGNSISVKLTGEISRSRNSNVPGGRVSYRKYFDEKERYDEPIATKTQNYDDIIFQDRGDAEVVLDTMNDLLEHFDVVRVADLYDLAGLECGYTENKFGWTDLRKAYVERTRDGYRLNLPRATSL